MKCVPVSNGIHWKGCYSGPIHTFLTSTGRCQSCCFCIAHYISVSCHMILVHLSVRNSDCRVWITFLAMIFPSWNTYNYSKWLSHSMIASSSSVHLGTIMSWFLRPCYDKRNWTLLPCSFMGDWWTSLSAVLSCKFLWVQFCRGAVQNRTKFQ